MKFRGLFVLAVQVFFSCFIFWQSPTSQAAPLISGEINSGQKSFLVTDRPHQGFDGRFFDDELATKISPQGELGAIFSPALHQHDFFLVDPLVVREVSVMSQGYALVDGSNIKGQTLAKDWLKQLAKLATQNRIRALPYGNPSGYWINRLNPERRNFFLRAGNRVFKENLGIAIQPVDKFQDLRYFPLGNLVRSTFQNMQQEIDSLQTVLPDGYLDEERLRAAAILNNTYSQANLQQLTLDLQSRILALHQKIRVTAGKMTLTSTTEKVPVTVNNDFSGPIHVVLYAAATNGKITVKRATNLLIPGNSKVQVLVPVHVLASGTSGLWLQLTNKRGSAVGEHIEIPITISVISPLTTWITILAASTLLAAVIAQSFRRKRKITREVVEDE